MGLNMLSNISNILGDNEYVMGGSEPTLIDCTVFGFLCHLLYLPGPEPLLGNVDKEEKYQNLVRYTERMKERYWPDWENCKFRP